MPVPPIEKFKPMKDAPRDGTVIIVTFNAFNDPKQPRQIAYAQWGCDQVGEVWTWRAPYRVGTTQHADGWLHIHEFIALQAATQKAAEPEFDL